jgi:hypothetical protein
MSYPKIVKSFLGSKCYYLSDNKRIRFKYGSDNFSKYVFEVKNGLFWRKIGSTYYSSVSNLKELEIGYGIAYKKYLEKLNLKKVDPFFENRNKIKQY